MSGFARRFVGVVDGSGSGCGSVLPDIDLDAQMRAARQMNDLQRLERAALREKAGSGSGSGSSVAGSVPMLRRFVCVTCKTRLPPWTSREMVRARHPGHNVEVKVQPRVMYTCGNASCRWKVGGWMGDTLSCRRCGTMCRLTSHAGKEGEGVGRVLV